MSSAGAAYLSSALERDIRRQCPDVAGCATGATGPEGQGEDVYASLRALILADAEAGFGAGGAWRPASGEGSLLASVLKARNGGSRECGSATEKGLH
jgi:hypothetical protein